MPRSRGRRPVSVTKFQFGFKVCPPRLSVNPALGFGPDFRLLNLSGQAMRVKFPLNLVLDSRGEPIREPFEMRDRDVRDLTVNLKYKPPRAGASEVYPYEVFMLKAQIEAIGCSRPDVEIQR